MSEPRTGNELTPRADDAPVVPVADGERHEVERFSAGPRAHMVGLTEERAAQVVRQSGNARNVAFLIFIVISLFIPVYWFYDIGIPAIGAEGRMEKTKDVQYVTDVGRGYALYLANCARCHGENGQGGVGPPLNNQDKLYNTVTPDGRVGTGHLNANYLHRVLEVGGRYVCGDANSLMPAWQQPAGPLNYREIEELITFLVASQDVEFEYPPEGAHAAEGTEPVTMRGWRDPNYEPDPAAPTPPACWRNPSGQIGGSAPAAGAGMTATIDTPGTSDNPRVIKLQETAALEILGEDGQKAASIAVKAGETVRFEIDNTAGYEHNFWIGSDAELAVPNATTTAGVKGFTTGVQTFDYTVPESGDLKFGCTVPGHYSLMNGALAIQP